MVNEAEYDLVKTSNIMKKEESGYHRGDSIILSLQDLKSVMESLEHTIDIPAHYLEVRVESENKRIKEAEYEEKEGKQVKVKDAIYSKIKKIHFKYSTFEQSNFEKSQEQPEE